MRKHNPRYENSNFFTRHAYNAQKVEKLKLWQSQGTEILYLSSHETAEDVAEKIMPDILIEDDCESIGGEKEMTITFIKPEIKQKIKSIIVKEFSGIDNLPNEINAI